MKLNQLIESIVLLPGSGEYVYAITNKDQKVKLAINNLRQDFPNVKNIAITISWYASSTQANNATVKPLKLENNDDPLSHVWNVGSFNRYNAEKVCFKALGIPCSGGTPSDQSVIDLVRFLYAASYKLTFLPLLLVNSPNDEWRGSISPDSPSAIINFFQKNGYNDYIMHYANLKDCFGVSLISYFENFIIGSELVGLTTYRDFGDAKFNGVEELKNLASKIKQLSPKTLISYAANGLGEYHHTNGGIYALDDLWCSKNIDFIGISLYFPLLEKDIKATIQNVFNGFTSAENADYYLSNNKKIYFDDPTWGSKNLKYWWSNFHYENDRKTCYIPEQKNVYIIEFGFSSSNFALQQPEVFPTLEKIQNGEFVVDYNLQQIGICASILFFKSQNFIKKYFLYAYDARPYEELVNQKLYVDHILFDYGHWFNHKGMENFECSLINNENYEYDL